MNRRGFLRGLVGGIAVAAAAPSFPFRVFSFPSEIVVCRSAFPSAWIIYEDAIREQLNQLSVARLFRKCGWESAEPGIIVTLHSSRVSNPLT